MSHPVVLIPGAGGQAWVWHLVEADLRQRGHDAFAVDLPAADEGKGLPAYADAVVAAIGDRDPGSPVAVAAYSLGAFTAPLVWQRVRVRQVIFVNAMIPQPGETPGAWWDNVGWVTRERLGIDPEVVPGGHLAALSRPAELATALVRYLRAADEVIAHLQ